MEKRRCQLEVGTFDVVFGDGFSPAEGEVGVVQWLGEVAHRLSDLIDEAVGEWASQQELSSVAMDRPDDVAFADEETSPGGAQAGDADGGEPTGESPRHA